MAGVGIIVRMITRIDNNMANGWLVRCVRDGEELEVLFSDWECGGDQKAKGAAMFFRDMLFMMR